MVAGVIAAGACTTNSAQPGVASAVAADSSVRGVFEGMTPCSAETRPLPQIPANTRCDQMIWKVVLYRDPATGNPTTYALDASYGMSKQGTTGLAGGGTAIEMKGRWDIAKGSEADADAVVYRLYGAGTEPAVSFLRLSDDLLHVLRSDRSLLVGNGAWSYTLNRTDNRPRPRPPADSPPEPPPRPPIPPTPPGSAILGIFEGRLPCHESILEITRTASYPGCAKVKSHLTLYRNQATGEPSSYRYVGVSTIRQGKWTIARGRDGDPDAIVYRLMLDDSSRYVPFLLVGEHHLFLLDEAGNLLVGNSLFSYTLSRTDRDLDTPP